MAPKTSNDNNTFSLPPQVVGHTDINRLLRELETLDESLIGKEDQQPAAAKISALLNLTATTNGYKLSVADDREQISIALKKIGEHAPLLHISFAAEPSPKVTEKILGWLRENVHRYALLQIGLSPGIAAGCMLRTPNKIFDMSLRASFDKQKPYLTQLIKAALSQQVQPGPEPKRSG